MNVDCDRAMAQILVRTAKSQCQQAINDRETQ